MPTPARRFASHARFAARNRLALGAAHSLEQSGGMLVHPVAIVAVCSLLTADLSAMVLPAVALSAGWIVGYAVAPVVLARTRRKLPWTIGAGIVRAASLALLAYVLAGGNVARDQRLRSLLICVVAYALAAGLARGASEALASRVVTARRLRPTDHAVQLVPAALTLIVGIGAFTLLVDAPRSPLPRLAVLFAVAAALSGAAILVLGRVVELPFLASSTRRPDMPAGTARGSALGLAWMILASLLGAVELFLLVGLSRDLALPRAVLLSGIGVFLAATAAASLAVDWIVSSRRLRALMELSAVLSGVAFALAIGLPTLIGMRQSPDTLLGRRPAEVGVWAAMALVAISQHARRRILPGLAERAPIAPAVVNLAGFALAFLPLAVAPALDAWDPERWLVAGLALALLSVVFGGVVSPRRAARPAVRPIAGPLPPTPSMSSLGGRPVR